VFCTTLSSEYFMVASAFGLSREALVRIAASAVDHIFADQSVKDRLAQLFAAHTTGAAELTHPRAKC
jgi:adenosine deaminase